jgi:hypothetical protein
MSCDNCQHPCSRAFGQPAYIVRLFREAAVLIQRATDLYGWQHNPHSCLRTIPRDHGLVRALAALADADRDLALDHAPGLFEPRAMPVGTSGFLEVRPMPPGTHQIPNPCYIPPPRVRLAPSYEVHHRYPRDVTFPGPDQQPGTIPSRTYPESP